MIRLSHIQTFLTVVEKGNFSKASHYLQISAMAVSKQINQLEKFLGISLFERGTRKMYLTEMGKALYTQFSEIVHSLDKVIQFVSSRKKTPVGTLTVAATPSAGEFFLIPYILEFLEKYPHMNLNLKLIERMPDFSQEKIDIAFAFPLADAIAQGGDLRYLKLLSFKRKIYASKEYLKKHGHPKKLQDCNGHHYLMNNSRINDEFLIACKKNHILLRPILSSNSILPLLHGCEKGLGLASIAEFIVQKLSFTKNLVALDHLLSYPSIEIYIFYRNLRFIDTKIHCFNTFFIEKLRSTDISSR